jgi:uncharacterized protein
MSSVKLLLIYFDETDQWEQIPLYEAVVRRLRQLGIAGATVNVGIMGFGSHQRVHGKRLFGVSDDRPVTVSVIETEEKLRAAIPEIRLLVKEGLMALVDAEIVPLNETASG